MAKRRFSEIAKIVTVKHYRETFNFVRGKKIHSLRKTAKLFKCSWTTISRWLKEYPAETKQPIERPKKFSDTVKIAAVKLYLESEFPSLRETAKLYTCHWTTLSKWVGLYSLWGRHYPA